MDTMTDLEKEIDETVDKAMQAWKVPGLALVIVKDDKVLHSKGYGVRDIGKPDKVDEHTLFAIGSNTKAFTATAVGLLVQEGKIAWDDSVTKYLPRFKLNDPRATHLISIRDLLCHRSGLGTWAGDVLLLSNYSTEEVVRRLQHIPLEYSFRAGYGYSNLMFITAGLIIETVSGLSWDEFIRERIFEPLGMTDSVTNPRFFGEKKNIATPHEDIKGKLQTVVQREDAHIGAAGSIHASVSDIAQWLKNAIESGKYRWKTNRELSHHRRDTHASYDHTADSHRKKVVPIPAFLCLWTRLVPQRLPWQIYRPPHRRRGRYALQCSIDP